MSAAELARALVACLDLTALAGDEYQAAIAAVCRRAMTPAGPVAAVCVAPRWVATARKALDGQGATGIPVATVVNFPDGTAPWAQVREALDAALAAGARELDVVIPHHRLDGAPGKVEAFARRVRAHSEGHTLKFILETGLLGDPERIRRAATLCLAAGPEFLKTSTGKRGSGASEEAVACMLETIRAAGSDCGVKVSGGVRSFAQARGYAELASAAMGPGWVGPRRFRIGASGLLDDLLAVAAR